MEVTGKSRRVDGKMLKDDTMRISHLSEEIVMYEILPWIPLKTLFKLKLVCKKWCKVISSDPLFKTSQSQRCLSLPPVLIYYQHVNEDFLYYGHSSYTLLPTIGRDMIPNPSLKFMNIRDGHLLASSNGLLCGFYDKEGKDYLYLSNPITKETVSIPNSNPLNYLGFAFEPLSCNPYYVLVVPKQELDQSDGTTEYSFTVYTSKTGIWSVANAKAQIFRKYLTLLGSRVRSVYTGGRLYWKLHNYVLWFDIEKDIAGVVVIPDDEDSPYGEIGDCHGVLSYTKLSTENIEVWLLLKSDEWVKKFCLSWRVIFGDQAKKDYFCYCVVNKLKLKPINHRRPLPYEGGDQVLIWLRGIEGYKGGIIISYNLKNGEVKYMDVEMMTRRTVLVSYKSSFVSPPPFQATTVVADQHTSGIIPQRLCQLS